METKKYIHYIVAFWVTIALLCGCTEEKNKPQQTEFNLRVDETVDIYLAKSTSYTITINNPAVTYELSGNRLTVTAIKEGKATLSAILDSGETTVYSFTVTPNKSQLGFNIDTTPRIESWAETTIKTEETPGLQVSCEPGIDIMGETADNSTRSYGFVYVETGKLLRFTAQGDFSQKGTLSDGIMATRENSNDPVQYESCTVTIEKVNSEGKIWFTLQFTDRSDIRIVTEVF